MTNKHGCVGNSGRLPDEFHAHVAAHVGGRIRRRRRAIDLTQEELAFRAAVHRTQITLIERGRRLPHIDTLIRLAVGLGVSPCQLIAGIDWEPVGEIGSTAGEAS
jgi:transcriptional regulator with XRE-family HTH domain